MAVRFPRGAADWPTLFLHQVIVSEILPSISFAAAKERTRRQCRRTPAEMGGLRYNRLADRPSHAQRERMAETHEAVQ